MSLNLDASVDLSSEDLRRAEDAAYYLRKNGFKVSEFGQEELSGETIGLLQLSNVFLRTRVSPDNEIIQTLGVRGIDQHYDVINLHTVEGKTVAKGVDSVTGLHAGFLNDLETKFPPRVLPLEREFINYMKGINSKPYQSAIVPDEVASTMVLLHEEMQGHSMNLANIEEQDKFDVRKIGVGSSCYMKAEYHTSKLSEERELKSLTLGLLPPGGKDPQYIMSLDVEEGTLQTMNGATLHYALEHLSRIKQEALAYSQKLEADTLKRMQSPTPLREVHTFDEDVMCPDFFKRVCDDIRFSSKKGIRNIGGRTGCRVDENTGLVVAFETGSSGDLGNTLTLGKVSENSQSVDWFVSLKDRVGAAVTVVKGQTREGAFRGIVETKRALQLG